MVHLRFDWGASGSRAFIRHRTRRADGLSGVIMDRFGAQISTEGEKTMSSSHSGLATSARRGYGCAATPLGRTRTKIGAQNPVRLTAQTKLLLENEIRLEERSKERARIVHELHDTLLQGFVGASMLLHQAVEQTPADSPSKPALSRVLHLVYRAIDEGRAAMRGLRTASAAPSSLEQAFASLLSEITTERGPRLRIFIQGKPRTLSPAIQEQLFLIGREAVINALRHSEATKIGVEVQYLDDLLRVVRSRQRLWNQFRIRAKKE